ncbi:molybdopterin-synthase adenylyltransferase MoeB [Ekhidna sp. To15]|uniref:molybdopterin-synthase adenylyltransferase MoeB n=1 Tax=Ekhidna sp. To15 TaxID=3395267 RepID=UPI003F525E09
MKWPFYLHLQVADFSRYNRQIKLTEVGQEGQAKLQNAKVLIVGAGGLGCPAALYLAAAGVGTIGLIDHDLVDETNLHRQILFTEKDIGRPKAEAAKEALEQRNSDIAIRSYAHPLNLENVLELFADYDLILDGTDNFQTKYLINDGCIKAGKPFIGASIYRYQGQLSVFNYQNGPTYRCLYPTHHYKDNSNCEETGVLGVLPGIMGTMQAAEAVKIILQIGTSLSGKLKVIDTLTMQGQLISFGKNEKGVERVKSEPLALEIAKCSIKEIDRMYLDVREPFEQPKPDNQELLEIPLNQLIDRHKEIPRDKKVYVYCQSGIRSKKAIALLEKEYGFDNLVDAGGIEALIS